MKNGVEIYFWMESMGADRYVIFVEGAVMLFPSPSLSPPPSIFHSAGSASSPPCASSIASAFAHICLRLFGYNTFVMGGQDLVNASLKGRKGGRIGDMEDMLDG